MRIPVSVLAAASVLCLSAGESAAFGWLFNGADQSAVGRDRSRIVTPLRPAPPRGEAVGSWVPQLPFWGGNSGRNSYYTNEDFDRPARSAPRMRAPHRVVRPALQAPVASPVRATEIAGELVIALQPGVPVSEAARIARRHRLTLAWSKEIGLLGQTVMVSRITVQNADEARKALAADPRVVSVQPNHLFRLVGPAVPDAAAKHYAAEKMHLAEAHRVAIGTGALVAVIDSAVDGNHPELAGRVTAVDAIGQAGAGSRGTGVRGPGVQNPGTYAPGIHGTAVAGIIASRAKLSGVAPGAQILSLRAFGEAGSKDAPGGSTVAILGALDEVRARGARVVNMSFEGPADPLIARALSAGRARSMIFIVAAGNGGAGSPAFPASDPNVIAATATGADDVPFAGAARGSYVALAAPGVDIIVPAPGGAYASASGTSYAAAQVTGLVALLLQLDPSLDAAGVRRLLVDSARKVEGQSSDRIGAGIADAAAAVQLARSPRASGPASTGLAASRTPDGQEPLPRPQ